MISSNSHKDLWITGATISALFRSSGDQTPSLSSWVVVTPFPEAGTSCGRGWQGLRRGRCDELRRLGTRKCQSPMCRSGAGWGASAGDGAEISAHEGVKVLRVSEVTQGQQRQLRQWEKWTKTGLWGPTSGGQAGEGAGDAPRCQGAGAPGHPVTSRLILLCYLFEPLSEISGFDPYFNLDLFSLRHCLD